MSVDENLSHPPPPRNLWVSRLWLVARLAVGLGLVYISLAQVNWLVLGSRLSSVQPAWLVIALASVLISTALKIIRWGLIFTVFGILRRPGWAALSGAFLVGQAANVVLPFRGGDLVRIGWLALDEREIILPVTLTILLEKYMDILAFMLVLFWLGPFLPGLVLERSKNWLIPLSAGLSVVLILVVGFAPQLWKKLRGLSLHPALSRIEPWLVRMDGWLAGIHQFRRWQSWLPLSALTLVIWLVMLSTNLFVLRALNLPADLRAGGLVLVLVYFGLAPALMPGNFGPFYFFAMLGLAPFGIEESLRAAYAVLLHAVVTLPPVMAAGGFLLAGRRRQEKRK